MKKILVFGVCCVFALTLAAQEVEKAVRIHPVGHLARPYLYRDPTAQTQCVAVPATDHTSADVGELVEIDYLTFTDYRVSCMKLPKIGLHHTALVPSPLGSVYILTGYYGVSRVATFFEAVQPGKARITLKIGGRNYSYRFVVSEAPSRP